MCNLYCLFMIIFVVGESWLGLCDGKNSLFFYLFGMCIYENFLFVCDSSNVLIRVFDILRLVF